MERPGMSLFQGSESLRLDTSLNRQEEEEAEEDQRRRNEELKNLLANGFDDFIDDDESSMLSSSHHTTPDNQGESRKSATAMEYQQSSNNNKNNNTRNIVHGNEHSYLEGAGDNNEVSEHYRHCFRTSPYNDNLQYRETEYGSVEQLQVLYEVRVREVQRLTEQIEQMKELTAQDKDKLYRRMTLMEAEKERFSMQLKQANLQLVSSEERVSELEGELETLKLNLENMKQTNKKLNGELEIARMSVKDLEQKVSLLERITVSKTDLMLRGVEEQNNKEVKNLHCQIESLTIKLKEKEKQNEELQKHIVVLNRNHEALMVEKTDTINQLMVNLEESQRQCQKLVLNLDDGKSSIEKERLEKQVKKLTMEIESIQADLKHYEGIAQFGLLGAEDSDSFRMYDKPQPTNDLNVKLRDELQRCLSGLKMKRSEIKKLKNQVDEQDKVIQKLREQEAAYLTQANSLKEDAAHLMEQLNRYQTAQNSSDDMTKLQTQVSGLQLELSTVRADNDTLKQELLSVRQQSVEEKLRAIDQHSVEYIQWHDKAVARVRQEAQQQIQTITADLSVRLKEAQRENDEVKQLYIDVCNSKEELLKRLAFEHRANKALANELDIETKNLMDAKAELESQRNKMAEMSEDQNSNIGEQLRQIIKSEKEKVQTLEKQVEAARERDKKYAETVTKDIEKAKQAALRELELKSKEYREHSDKATSPMRNNNEQEEKLAEIVAKLKTQHQEQLEQVKQESVRCLANELSACETRHRQQLENAEEEYSRNLATFRGLIDSKTQEVEILKKAMLIERDKLREERENHQDTEELASRINEIRMLEERLESCEKEWQEKLATHEKEFDAERDKMAEAIAGWAEELQTLRKQQQEMENKSVELQNKYEAAKKTARRYKTWADGKEKHIEQEWHRIVTSFHEALQSLYNKAETALSHQEDNTVIKYLEKQIQELQDKLSQHTPR